MEMVRLSNIQLRKLSSLVPIYNFSCLDTLFLTPSLRKILLYPTDDFHLSEDQFDVIKTIIPCGNSLYVAQIGHGQNSILHSTPVYKLKQPFDYREYQEIWLDTISFIFSDSYEWVIVIDESLIGGEGLFIGNDVAASQFWKQYKRGNSDIAEFVQFCVNEHKKRDIGFEHMLNILHMCK